MKSASAILLQAQLEQHKHDLRAHRDILYLDTHTKIKHMTLHFIKYASRILDARQQQSKAILEKALLDSLIICLATANALNLHVSKNSYINAKNLDDLCTILSQMSSSATDVYERALTALVVHSGKMAKAIESTDHLERGDPRSVLEAEVENLTLDILTIIGSEGMKIGNLMSDRWNKVEEKNIFFGTTF
jgi:hypothetical protein